MPELSDQMYCSEQISIPPSFPYLLRQYAKAAIRSQPVDLLQWSTAYFRCLSLNIPPPVKPRLEYPIPRDYYGITPGWLKALLYQLRNNQTISFKILWDRWTGACLSHTTLIQILCLGGFDKPDAIPWLRFIGLCAAHLTEPFRRYQCYPILILDTLHTYLSNILLGKCDPDVVPPKFRSLVIMFVYTFLTQSSTKDLTNTMKLICEIMTEEPEGGSAMIPLETFRDLYEFLAAIDASKPQKLRNLYFSDSLLSLWRETSEKDEQPKEIQEEAVMEEESLKSQVTEKSESEESVKQYSKEEISCPSLVGDDHYSIDYYIPEAEEEQNFLPLEGLTEDYLERIGESFSMPGEGGGEDRELMDIDNDSKERSLDEDREKELTSEHSEEEQTDLVHEEKQEEEIQIRGEDNEEKYKDIDEKESAVEQTAEPTPQESVDTIQETPRKIVAEDFEDEKTLLEDLQRLKALQQEIAGETDEEVEKYKCKLIEEMPQTESQEIAIKEFEDVDVEKEPDEETMKIEETEQEEKEKTAQDEEVYVDAIPGIGPQVPEHLVKAVCEYMKSVSVIQHGMVMPRNIRHYNCPPLELLEY